MSRASGPEPQMLFRSPPRAPRRNALSEAAQQPVAGAVGGIMMPNPYFGTFQEWSHQVGTIRSTFKVVCYRRTDKHRAMPSGK